MFNKAMERERGLALYWQLVKPQRRHILVHFILLALSIGVQAPIPFLLSKMIDSFSRQDSFSELAATIVWMGGLSMLGVVLSVMCQIYGATITKNFLMNARLSLFGALQRAPLRCVRAFDISDLYTRLSRDIGSLNYLSPAGVAGVARDLFFVLIFGGILITLNQVLLLWLAGLLPVAVIIFRQVGKRVSGLASISHVAYAGSNARLLESIACMREARLADTRLFHYERLAASLDYSEESSLKVRKSSASMLGALGLIPVVAAMVIWTVGGLKIAENTMSVGQVVSFFVVLTMMYGPISSLFGAASGYAYEKAAFKRLVEIFFNISCGAEENTARHVEPRRAVTAPAEVELREIVFSYGEDVILDRFSMAFPSGLCTAISGPNGAGKSTLLSIIMGISAPSSGGAILNGRPAGDADSGMISKICGFLPQDVFIYSDSFRVNVTLGRDISDAQIHAAANELGLADFLLKWPQGLDTLILEAGRDLSGGEKQKIGLLRATVNNPTLLILDEPENNLDQASVAGLISFLHKLKGRSTVVMVTHGNAFECVIDHSVDISAS